MFPGAGFYGIRKILLNYAKLPTFLPLPVAVQHGWYRYAPKFESNASPPEIWVWSQRIAKEFEAIYPKDNIRIVGSFFYYLIELIRDKLPPVKCSGSICIPPHSSHFISTKYSVEDFARSLSELGEDYMPITVMLYYLDITDDTIKAYENFGFKIVSNGTLYDPDFLVNFVHNIYDKKHCIFSDIGSGVFFSAEWGLNLVHLDITSTYVNQGEKTITNKYLTNIKKFDDKVLLTLNKDKICSELGKSHMLSSSMLRKLIIKNYFTWAFVKGMTMQIFRKLSRIINFEES